jgi:mannonate dehydratase
MQPTDSRLRFIKQLGVDDVLLNMYETPVLADSEKPLTGEVKWEYEELLHLRTRINEAGLRLNAIENIPISFYDDVMLGRDGRDEQLEGVKETVRNLGRADIPVLGYNWMPNFVWSSSTTYPVRGGAQARAYDHDQLKDAPPSHGREYTEAEFWENYEHFAEEVVPVAEEAGVKLALHPDDPPHGPIRGCDRIITSVENYRRVMEMYDSEANGITLCQGNFSAMGADVPAAIREFDERIHFVHVRDVEGTADEFTEVWHDEGPTDLGACIRAYEEIGYDGPLRPDHCPTMAGEDNASPGYHDKGRLWAIGYLQGLRDQYRSMAGE